MQFIRWSTLCQHCTSSAKAHLVTAVCFECFLCATQRGSGVLQFLSTLPSDALKLLCQLFHLRLKLHSVMVPASCLGPQCSRLQSVHVGGQSLCLISKMLTCCVSAHGSYLSSEVVEGSTNARSAELYY